MTGIYVDPVTGNPSLNRSPLEQFVATVPAGQTVVIDSLPLSDFDFLKYELSIFGPTQDDTKSMGLRVQQFSTGLVDQVYGRIGNLSVSIDTVVNGLDFELTATNNEAFQVGVCLTLLAT